MKIDNFKVYDLPESIAAARLPMNPEYDTEEFENDTFGLNLNVCGSGTIQKNPIFQRAAKLAVNPPGTGHNNFLSGILVAANVTASNAWWLQFGRYHFAQIVSSQSKMHRIRQMLSDGKFPFFGGAADLFRAFQKVVEDKDCSDEGLIMQTPLGLQLTARITTNYLQLKTIYRQRRKHKLTEWQEFCDWIEDLPFAGHFICAEPEPRVIVSDPEQVNKAMLAELCRCRDLMNAAANDMEKGRIYKGTTGKCGFARQRDLIDKVIKTAEGKKK